MDVNYLRVRRVILNDRSFGYKPDKKCIEKLSDRLPDCRILGFGKYYEQPPPSGWTWYLYVESQSFIEDPDALNSSVPMTSLFKDLT